MYSILLILLFQYNYLVDCLESDHFIKFIEEEYKYDSSHRKLQDSGSTTVSIIMITGFFMFILIGVCRKVCSNSPLPPVELDDISFHVTTRTQGPSMFDRISGLTDGIGVKKYK
jgi:hypothetical protein